MRVRVQNSETQTTVVDEEFEYDSVSEDGDGGAEFTGEAASDIQISIEVSKRELRAMIADIGGPGVLYGQE